MTETGALLENPRAVREKVESADILVAIPTYNDAETIGALINAAYEGMEYFSGRRIVVAQMDGGSTDATIERAAASARPDPPLVQMTYPIYPVHRLELSDRGVPGRESAYRSIFGVAQELGARVCCVVEPGISAVTADWIGALVRPVLESDYDFVAPYYQRHKYEGMLVNGILYPFTRALYGKRLRHPVGSDFGLSGSFVSRCLAADRAGGDQIRREIDVWMNVQALSGDVKVCQARLGARTRARKEGAPDLSSVLANVAGAIYGNAEQTAEIWQRVRGSISVPTFGLRFDADVEAPQVDPARMIENFQAGYQNLREIWGQVLPPAALLEIKKASRLPAASFSIGDELWARVVYDFAIGHRLGTIAREHLLRALTPLYMGWAASFVLSVRESSSAQAEERIERLASAFEQQKSYLISRWRWPDRFMP